MKFKKGVVVLPNDQYGHIKYAVDHAFNKVVGHECMMTSGSDGEHSAKSLHYQFCAWDFRIYVNNEPHRGKYNPEVLADLVKELKAVLGSMYDVVLEKTHIHVEYDPK